MWKIQLPGGEFLDSVPALTFELNNQVFSNSDSSVLPGSFSFPVDLPLNPTNRRLLNFPDLVTNSRNFQTYAGCWVYAEGIPMFYGTLTIRSATDRKCSVNIVANPLSALKTVPLRDLSLGGDRTFADAAAVLAHAKLTAQNPLDYDYVFFPVFNDKYLDTPTSDSRCVMQNHWSAASSVFQVAQDYPALMPFVRAEYLVGRIFADIEFAFSDRFHLTDEARQICLYNNRSLWTSAGLETVINLKNHLSKTASTDWLRAYIGDFNLGLFTNVFSKTISLVPLVDLISATPRHNWTEFQAGAPTISSAPTAPEAFMFKDYDETQQYSTRMGLPAPADVLATFDTIQDLLDDPTYGFISGIYYITGREAYYALNTDYSYPENIRRWYDELGPAPVRDAKEVFECGLPPLHDYWYASDFLTGSPASGPNGVMPFCRIPGSVNYTPTGETDPVKQENDTPDRLMIYRGYVPDIAAHDYPQACLTTYDNDGGDIGTFSMRLQGDRGLYNTWWRPWHQMLVNGKHITQSFVMPVTELMQFSFESKVRVQNMDFFVKKLSVQKLVGRGLALVEASMVSTV